MHDGVLMEYQLHLVDWYLCMYRNNMLIWYGILVNYMSYGTSGSCWHVNGISVKFGILVYVYVWQ